MSDTSALERTAFVSLFLSLLSCVEGLPVYNVPIALFAQVAAHTKSGKHVFALVMSLFVSLIIDIVWAIAHKDAIDRGNVLFVIAFALSVGNMLAKAVCLYFTYNLFVDIGGTWSLTDSKVPEDDRASFDRARTPSSFSDYDAPRSADYAAYQATPGQSQASL